MAIFFINAVIKKQKEINNKFKHKPNIKQVLFINLSF